MAQLPEIGACMLLCVAPLAGEGGAHPLRSSPSAFCSRSHPGGWDLLKPGCLEPVLCDKRSSCNEKPMHSKDPVQPKINKIFFKLKKKKSKGLNRCGLRLLRALETGWEDGMSENHADLLS